MFDPRDIIKTLNKALLSVALIILFVNIPIYAQEIVKPDWVTNQTTSNLAGKKCFVGVSMDQKSRDDGLDYAYKNTLSEIVKKEFPELIKISERSNEGLKNTTYNREYIQQSDKIKWEGIEEDNQSPYVEINKQGNDTFNVYRRLCWSSDQIKNEKTRIKEEDKQLQTYSSKIDGLIPNGKSGEVGKLVVTSIPQGASVILDGEHIGRSNSMFENVVQGEYELILQLDGYELQKTDVIINKGKTTNYNVKLQKTQALLNINSSVPSTRIYINNKPAGKAPLSLKLNTLEKYQIRAEDFDYETETKDVILEYAPQDVTFNLKMLSGQISILSIPSGANIKIDETMIEEKTPLYLKRIAGGDHRISISQLKFEPYEEIVSVRKSKVKTLSARLVSVSESESKRKQQDEENRRTKEESDKKFAEEMNYSNQQKKFWSNLKPAAIGGGLISSGIIMLAYSYKYAQDANSNYTKYKNSNDPAEILSHKQKTKEFDKNSSLLMVYGSIATITGGAYLYMKFDF